MASDFISVIQPGDPSQREGSGDRVLPILPVRDTVLFPHAVLPLTVGRESSIQLIQSLGEEKTIVVVAQRDARVDAPQPQDLHTFRHTGDGAQGRQDAEPEPLCLYRGHGAGEAGRVFADRAVHDWLRWRRYRRCRTEGPGDRGAAAECGESVPADCDRLRRRSPTSCRRLRSTSTSRAGWWTSLRRRCRF